MPSASFDTNQTSFDITAQVDESDLDLQVTALDLLSLYVVDGVLTLDEDGAGPLTGPASFSVGFDGGGVPQVDLTGGLAISRLSTLW